MIKHILSQAIQAAAPGLVTPWFESRWLHQDAVAFRTEIAARAKLEDKVDYAITHPRLLSNQKRSEILSLTKLLSELRPRTICEIGSDRGGTLGLYAAVSAPNVRILSIDIQYRPARRSAFPRLAQPGQQITCLEADSHDSDTLRKVRAWLANDTFDFLFVDGDHSYEGVKMDFESFAPLVTPGGLIAFHDIVPDSFTRCGIKSHSDVGEVPRYWQELKCSHTNTQELIEDPDQDGYGIGIIPSFHYSINS